jgi:hypothetical protein
LLCSNSRQGRLVLRHKIASPIPEPIEQLQRQLNQFRSGHPHRTRLPESLWQSAVELARQHGLYSVAHPLRLDYMQLKRRLGGVDRFSCFGDDIGVLDRVRVLDRQQGAHTLEKFGRT